MNTKKENFTVICKDGVPLQGVLLIPESPKGVIQFNGGTAAKKEFYLPFLEYLAEDGYICCLWDYRGSGSSAPAELSKCDFTFSDYGIKDMPAIKKYLTERFSKQPFFIFGHSAGGQQIGFMEDLDGVQGVVNFAVSTGYLFHMPLSYRAVSMFFFYMFSPVSILVAGSVKAKKFGIMEDLPKNVVKEWKKWCEKKEYFFDKNFYGKTVPVGSFQNYKFPIHTFWATDDPISNERSVKTFWNKIKSTKPITFTKIEPSDLKVKTIGHFGFFKKNMKAKLWKETVLKFDEFLKNSQS